MFNLKERAKYALSGENGGPSVETIIGIIVALIAGVAFIALGRLIVGKINEAGTSIDSMEVGDLS